MYYVMIIYLLLTILYYPLILPKTLNIPKNSEKGEFHRTRNKHRVTR